MITRCDDYTCVCYRPIVADLSCPNCGHYGRFPAYVNNMAPQQKRVICRECKVYASADVVRAQLREIRAARPRTCPSSAAEVTP